MRKTIKKIMSSALSAVLAFGVCVPMASIAPMAYAADAGVTRQDVCNHASLRLESVSEITNLDSSASFSGPAYVFSVSFPDLNLEDNGVKVKFATNRAEGFTSITTSSGNVCSEKDLESSYRFLNFGANDCVDMLAISKDSISVEEFPLQSIKFSMSGMFNGGWSFFDLTFRDVALNGVSGYVPSYNIAINDINTSDGASGSLNGKIVSLDVPFDSSNDFGANEVSFSVVDNTTKGIYGKLDSNSSYTKEVDLSVLDKGIYSVEVKNETNNTEYISASISVMSDDASAPSENGTPTIVMNAPDGVKPGTEYEVYRVFNADVLDKEVADDKNITNAVVSGNKYITNIEFAEGVEGLFELTEGQTAYNAAIALRDVLHGEDAVNQGIAWAQKLNAQYVATITAGGEPLEVGSTGYYLLVNKNQVDGVEVAVSYPIFAAVGNETLEITEKSAIPYITKYVKEDSNGEWQKYADFAKKDIQEFKFEITMPNNIAQYPFYAMTITDTTLHYMEMTDLVVSIDKTPIDSALYTYADGVFTFADIKALGVDVTLDSIMTIEYKAFANDAIDVPANNEVHTVDPYVNKVVMNYSNNPANDASIGTSVDSITNEYSYGIRVKVEERITDAPLPGFGFTVADSDGNKVADAAGNTIWMTNMDGVIELPYLDADDYTITCVEKALGYDADVETFTLKLLPTYDKTLGTLDEFGADVPEGFNAQRRAGVEKADNTWVLADGGYGNVTLSIPSNMNMPITGEGGYALIIAAGLALITVAVVRTYRSRRNTIA